MLNTQKQALPSLFALFFIPRSLFLGRSRELGGGGGGGDRALQKQNTKESQKEDSQFGLKLRLLWCRRGLEGSQQVLRHQQVLQDLPEP